MAPSFILPDFSADWPFRRTLHPYYETTARDSAKWVESFHILDDKAQTAFNRCNFSLLASLTYPHTDRRHLRVACDLINWFFVFDEWSDSLDGASARLLAARLTDILRDPLKPRPEGQSAVEIMTTNFWTRCLEFASPISAKRFVQSMEPYIEGVVQEAEDREHGRVRSLEEYLTLRRKTVGAKPSYDFLLLSEDLPEEVVTHPHIEKLTQAAVDMIIILNDVYSWNYERSHGLDEHNLVSVVMAENNFDIQKAIDYVGAWYRDISQKFVVDMNDVPSFSQTIDPIVAEYIFGLGNGVTGYLEWAFESERYFGLNGAEVKSSRVVDLLPRKLDLK